MDVFEHFIKDPTGTYVGNHLVVDLWGVVNHNDPNTIMDCFTKSCTDAGATVLFEHCHMFGENEGYTGVVVLSESHLSFHTYFEVNLVSLDIFMCGTAHPERAMPRIRDFWKPKSVDYNHIRRGIVSAHKLPVHLAARIPNT